MKVRDLVKLVEAAGWVYVRHEGSHMVFRHPDYRRPLSIPNHGAGRDVGKNLVYRILRQAGLH